MNVCAFERRNIAVSTTRGRLLWLPLVSLWVLGLLTFSLPGREGLDTFGALDPLALAKVAARGAVIVAWLAVVFHYRNHPRQRLLRDAMLPFWLFVAWAVLSVAWSPLKAVSLGQAGGLAAQLVLATLIGLAAADAEARMRVIRQINVFLLTVAAILVSLHIVSPESSGLTRGLIDRGSTGAFHPTSAGATASLGMVVLVLTSLIWKPRWAGWMFLPAVPIYSALLLLAASRMALFMTGLILLLALATLAPRHWLAALAVVVCSLGVLYLCLDPGLELVDTMLSGGAQFLSRNEPPESLKSLTGRTAMWEAIWAECLESPWRGCGYFVTSQNGLLDVWTEPANRTAHNFLLQVLVSTGLIGLALFLWGLFRIVRRSALDLAATGPGRQLGVFLLLVGCWYAGWGQLCSSFMGPIQPESLVFFCCLGLALAVLRAPTAETSFAAVH